MKNEKMEHLKMMNADNMLDQQDLDQVAGGTNSAEVGEDSRFLNVLLRGRPEQPERHGRVYCSFYWHEVIGELEKAWNSLGIDYVQGNGAHYWLNGKEITRTMAWIHAGDVMGRRLTREEWDW